MGIKPNRPETGYGYIEVGETIDDSIGSKSVVRFVENGGRRAVITSLDRIEDAVHGRAGTVVEEERSGDHG